MEAGKAADAYGLFAGHDVQLCDAEQAYTQSLMTGVPTWVELPRNRWPQSWVDKGYRRPVCRMLRALYGHPDAGGMWERHNEEHLFSVGWESIKSWPSCYWNAKHQCVLVVYVDDFKMAGPKTALVHAWADINKGIKMQSEPTLVDKYLGCSHRELPGCLSKAGQVSIGGVRAPNCIPEPDPEKPPAADQGGSGLPRH